MAHVAPHNPEVAPTAVAEEPMLIHHWAESGGRYAEGMAEAKQTTAEAEEPSV